ncbi:hypothetical protein [Kluyvera intermedia]|uniref:hypothetical protein n=1 Tax=Kluyvera intermedia TaxID=61648 RepID=UPI003524878B
MAGKSTKFNASINFGASVDPSMTRTLNRMTSGIDRIGTESAQVMKTQTAWQRQMKAGSASTVNQIKHTERAMQTLISKQEALEKEIRDGVKSGRAGMSFLIEDYKKVGHGIENARKELERLNNEQEKEQRLEKKQQEKTRRQEARRIKWQERGENLTTQGRATIASGARALIKAPVAIAGAGIAGAAGLGGGILALNRKTAEEYRHAKKYGMSFEQYKAGSIMAEQAGLNGENYGDLTEELSNKLGEEGNDKTVNPMLAMLGLNKHLMKGTKQQQFDLIMKKLVGGVRDGSLKPEQAESLADQLMGGEGNKMLTYLLSTNKSYEQVMKEAAELNNITEDEARGALESSQILSNMWTAAETSLAGMAGEIGSALQPQLKVWEGQFAAWVKNNKAMITNAITAWVDDGGPKRVVDGLTAFGQVVWAVVEKLKWILPDPEQMTKDQKKIADYLAWGNPLEGGKLLAKEYDLEDWFNEQHFDDPSVRRQLRERWLRNQMPVDAGVDTPETMPIVNVPLSRTHVTEQTNHLSITVHAVPGETPEDIGQRIYEGFVNSLPPAAATGSDDTFDYPWG